MKILLILVVAIVMIGCATTEHRKRSPEEVSIIELIATPEKYANKRIAVVGYYHGELEFSAIFLTKDYADYFKFRMENCIWLGQAAQSTDRTKVEGINDCFVYVAGTFIFQRNRGLGHMGLFRRAIEDITVLSKIEPKSDAPQ